MELLKLFFVACLIVVGALLALWILWRSLYAQFGRSLVDVLLKGPGLPKPVSDKVPLGVYSVVGKQGTGKTLFVNVLARYYAAKGAWVFSNVPLGVRYIPIKSLADLEKMRKGDRPYFVFIDEVQVVYRAGGPGSVPDADLAVLTQARKRGACIVIAAQAVSRIPKVMREQLAEVWRPRIVAMFMYVRRSDVSQWSDTSLAWSGSVYGAWLIPLLQEDLTTYDTTHVVESGKKR